MTLALIASALLLLLVCLRPPVAGGRRKWPILLLVGGALLTVSASTLIIRKGDFYPATWSLRLAKSTEIALREAAADPDVRDVIILEGSSYSARGLDGPMLQRLLDSDDARAIRVIQMSLDGANHFERTWMLDVALARLSKRERDALERKNVIVMLEIQRGYDHDPVNGLARNAGSDRAFAYMTPGNGWGALRSVWSVTPESYGYLGAARITRIVAWHVAVNAMNAGLYSRQVSYSDVKVLASYRPLAKSKRGFRFSGMPLDLKSAGDAARDQSVPEWAATLRVERYLNLYDGLADRVGFYSVPSIEREDLQYMRDFCARVQELACIHYDDPALLRRLDRRSDWNDARHMRKGGAQKFTRWFAKRLLRDLGRMNYL